MRYRVDESGELVEVTDAEYEAQRQADASAASTDPLTPPPTPTGVAQDMATTITNALDGVAAGATADDVKAAIVNALAPYVPPAA